MPVVRVVGMSRREILSHHSLRGIAAILVAFYHFRDAIYDKSAALDALTPFFANGYLWVDLFFVLSGFVLTYVYYKPSETPPSSQVLDWRRFLSARFARIYPLHLFTLLMLLAFESALHLGHLTTEPIFDGQRRSIESFGANLILIQGWGIFNTLTWNFPSWSISTEAFAYLVFPFLMFILSTSRIKGTIGFLLFGVLMIGFILTNNEKIEDAYPLLRCLGEFLLGVSAYSVWEKIGGLSLAQANFMQTIAIGGVIASMHLDFNDGVSVGFFVLLVVSTADDRGWLSRILNFRPLVYLGVISYSTYLVHGLLHFAYWQLGGHVFSGIASHYSATKVSILKVTSLLALSILIASFTYRYVEVPARNYFRKKQSRS